MTSEECNEESGPPTMWKQVSIVKKVVKYLVGWPPRLHPWRKDCTNSGKASAEHLGCSLTLTTDNAPLLSPFYWLIPSFLLTIVLLIVIVVLDSQLDSDEASGYSAIEYAGTKSQAEDVLDSWDEQQKRIAAFSAGVHYLFIFSYSYFATVAILWGANNAPFPIAWLGDIVAWVFLVGSVLDLILHSLVAGMVIDGVKSGEAEAAIVFAIAHNLILAVGVLFLVIELIGMCSCWYCFGPCKRCCTCHKPLVNYIRKQVKTATLRKASQRVNSSSDATTEDHGVLDTSNSSTSLSEISTSSAST